MFSVIVGRHDSREKPVPIGWFFVGQFVKLRPHGRVPSFYLAVGLRVVRGGQGVFAAHQLR